MDRKTIVSNVGIPLAALVFVCLVAVTVGNIGGNDNSIPKGRSADYRNITGAKCSITLKEATYDLGILTVDVFVIYEFTNKELANFLNDPSLEASLDDARLSSVIKGLFSGDIFLENSKGIKREPLSLDVDADSELKCASIKIAFAADDKDEYALNIESYSTDIEKRIIRFSLK